MAFSGSPSSAAVEENRIRFPAHLDLFNEKRESGKMKHPFLISSMRKLSPCLVLFFFLLLISTASSKKERNAAFLEEEFEKQDRTVLAKTREKTTTPQNDYLIDHECQFGDDEKGPKPNDKTCRADKAHRRSVFPAQEPLVCLAFLSCCGRTDLLQSTMNAVTTHLEKDEPDILRQHYEIAWVDNGSPYEKQQHIEQTFEIDHALPMPVNMGLAWGMNALIFDLCTAPYILLLEEDWLYMDEKVAEPTVQRRHAIARAIALLQSNPVDPTTQRPLKGVFLRTESNIVPTVKAVIPKATIPAKSYQDVPYEVEQLEYRISCMNFQQTGHIFGAYSNGASMFDRAALVEIGRMYGEPGDIFSDLSVEGNFGFRVGLKYCAARMLMDPQMPQCDFDAHKDVPPTCAAAFAHIGGGRGTRPARRKHMKCVDDAWNFYGTPYFDKFPKQECSKSLPTIWEQLKLNAEFKRVNDLHNEAVFAKEQEQRKLMLQLADVFEPKCKNPDEFRSYYGPHDPQYAAMSDEEIRRFPAKLRNMATSDHQLPGFWDILGRPIGVDFDMPE
jgi:hypothetical protein